MKEVNQENNVLDEEYLDCLIKLAFDLDDLEKEQQIREEAKDDELAPDEFTSRRIWQMAQEKMDRYEQEQKRSRRRNAARRIVPQVLKIAACLLLAVSIGVPVVIASSAEIRSRVIQMLMSIDQKNQVATIRFEENPDAAFSVPADWTGDYYPSYIPEGMEIIWSNDIFPQVEYADKSKNDDEKPFFSYEEQQEQNMVLAGTEDTLISHAEIGGREASIFDYGNSVMTIVWQNDERMFTLSCRNMDRDEVLKVADSVRKIIR